MASINDTVRRWKTETAYFAASNSYKGFYSYFEQIFRNDGIDHLYIIKGGPGTGKSSLMRYIAERCESVGGEIEYYYCSSDQSSLDGIIVRLARACIAVIDGTAPHALEPALPGVREEIVDLGQFWRSEALYRAEVGERVEALCREKGRLFNEAVCYLAAYERVVAAKHSELSPRDGRLHFRAREILSELGVKKNGRALPSLIDSVGVHGRLRLSTFERLAVECYRIPVLHGIGFDLLCAICEAARSGGLEMRISFDPIIPTRINAILFEGDGICLYVDEGHINSPKDVKDIDVTLHCRFNHDRVKELETVGAQLYGLALEKLGTIAGKHAELEQIYIDAMDFESVNTFREHLCDRILSAFA